LATSALICSISNGTIETNSRIPMRMTPNRINAVAAPRRQPCAAKKLTAGSIAKDRNREMMTRKTRPRTLSSPRSNRYAPTT
jgi:hypothetical protein